MADYIWQWGEQGEITELPALEYVCGFCHLQVGSTKGIFGFKRGQLETRMAADTQGMGKLVAIKDKSTRRAYICPNCERISYWEDGRILWPSPQVGTDVPSLPAEIEQVYTEIRGAAGYKLNRSVLLLARSLLMHVAVGLGAPQKKTFQYYVEFFDEQHHIPANAKGWVQWIKDVGNESAHDITGVSDEIVSGVLSLVELLLRNIYSAPQAIPNKSRRNLETS